MQTDALLKYFTTETSNPDVVEKLQSHKITKKVSIENSKLCYDSPTGKKYYPGITRPIKKKYFENFKYPTGRLNHRCSSSIATGQRVHRQIHHIYTCLGKNKKCDCTTKTSLKRLSAGTRAAKKFLSDMEIVPDDTEYPIVSPTIKMATSLDMIGTRWPGTPKARSVIISWKTGYSAGYDINSSEQKLSPPLDTYESTSQNHNALQGILEYQMIANDYGLRFDDYYIVYLQQDKSKPYNVDILKAAEIFKKEKDVIYESFK